MEYKTIVVHVDASGGAPARTAFAAALARDRNAHLIGTTQTGIARFVSQTALPGVDLSGLTPLFEQLENEARQRARDFDEAAGRAGVASFEHRVGDEEPATALARQGLYADLVVVGRAHADGREHPNDAAIPQTVALNAPCPVLVLPQTGTLPPPAFGRVMVAWNASQEAARAVRLALPFLARAGAVDVAVFDDDEAARPAPAADACIAAFLARHGVHAGVRRHHARGDVGSALLVLAGETKADLLVTGCYGHSRLREIMLGGVSRTVLRRACLPVLIAH